MAQADLTPIIKIKGENVDTYVKAICSAIGVDPPEGEITNPQLNILIRSLMNSAVRIYRKENYKPPDPE